MKKWKKVLYEDQGYPDNYTDQTFLRDLRKNVHTKEVTLKEAILGATLLLQEFCTVIAFVLVYIYLYNDWVSPSAIFYYSNILTVFGFILYRFVFSDNVKEKLGYDLRTVLIFMVFGHLFSPILHTLTDSISTDTIYMMSFFMLLVHLLFYDYGVSAAMVSNSLSLSAAVFTSICLASRLSSAHHAFILITIAVECFVLFPLFRNRVGESVLLTIFMLICNSFFLWRLSELFLLIFIATVVFINILCPILFVKYQKYKENIYGPWDEAIVTDTFIVNK